MASITITDPAIEKLFWRYVNKAPGQGPAGECWLWTGTKGGASGMFLKQKSYGLFKVSGKLKAAHRLAYELSYGPIRETYNVIQTCNQRTCCNPSHLIECTRQESTLRGRERNKKLNRREPRGVRANRAIRALSKELNIPVTELVTAIASLSADLP